MAVQMIHREHLQSKLVAIFDTYGFYLPAC